MTDIHPRLLALIEQHLPEGGQVVKVLKTTLETTTLEVVVNDEVIEVTLDKHDTATHFNGQRLIVLANEGDSWESVFNTLMDTYHLWLTPGVDFTPLEGVVEFGEEDTITHSVSLLPDGLVLYGRILMQVQDKSYFTRHTAPLRSLLGVCRTQLALTTKIFDTHEVVVGGMGASGRLAEGFVSQVMEYTSELDLSVRLSAGELLSAVPLEITHDGISQMVLITARDNVWFLRFRLAPLN